MLGLELGPERAILTKRQMTMKDEEGSLKGTRGSRSLLRARARFPISRGYLFNPLSALREAAINQTPLIQRLSSELVGALRAASLAFDVSVLDNLC
jgi:hypothetical protein